MLLRVLLSLLFIFSFLGAEEAFSHYLQLSGYLDERQLGDAEKTFSSLPNQSKVYIELTSSSGDLPRVLSFASKLYSLKEDKKTHLVLLINELALGPSAILPFLAEEIYITKVASWGDIPYGTEGALPANVLRNRVEGLINPKIKNYAFFQILAAAMSDPTLIVEDIKGDWRLSSDAKPPQGRIIKRAGETLVLNQFQMIDKEIVKEVLDVEEFRKEFLPSKTEPDTSAEARQARDLMTRLKEHIKYNSEGPNKIGYIAINDKSDSISQSTWLYVKKALEYYEKNKPAFIILHLNTPGGQVFPAQQISDALHQFDLKQGIPVVTFIDDWAISAGAMLAYSTRFITGTTSASMGAAEPVIQSVEGQMQTASEKVNSAMRTDFGNRARFYDRNPDIAQAMVDKDILLVWRHGKVVRLDSNEQIRKTGPDPDVIISPIGKLLTLDADGMMKYGVADMVMKPVATETISNQEKETGRWPVSKMLLFHYPYFKDIPQGTIDAYIMDWKTKFFVLLASPVVSSLLFMGMLMGFYMEISTPGFGVPGTIALTCFLLIVISTLSLEIANWLEVILVLIGIGMVLLEILVFPTAGLLGIIGGLSFLIGFFGMLIPNLDKVSFEPQTGTVNAAGEFFIERLAQLFAVLLLSFLGMFLIGRYFAPKMGTWQRLVLKGGEQDASEGFVAGIDRKNLPQVGAKGQVVSALRPAGRVMIENTTYQAISRGNFLTEGTSVVVVGFEGSSILVEESVEE